MKLLDFSVSRQAILSDSKTGLSGTCSSMAESCKRLYGAVVSVGAACRPRAGAAKINTCARNYSICNRKQFRRIT